LFVEMRWTWRALSILTLIVSAVALVFGAAARGGVLGCAVGLAAFASWMFLRRSRAARPLISNTKRGIILAGITIALVIAAGQLLTSRLEKFGNDSASIGRMILWTDILDRILPNVWLSGTGPGMFRVAF